MNAEVLVLNIVFWWYLVSLKIVAAKKASASTVGDKSEGPSKQKGGSPWRVKLNAHNEDGKDEEATGAAFVSPPFLLCDDHALHSIL